MSLIVKVLLGAGSGVLLSLGVICPLAHTKHLIQLNSTVPDFLSKRESIVKAVHPSHA